MGLDGSLERRGGPVFAASLALRRGLTVAAIAALGAGAWWVTWLSGGTKGAFVHLFYVPIILAATRFKAVGAVVVAVSAGLAAGPLMPLDVSQHLAQEPRNWALRLAFFLLIGMTVALLSHRSLADLVDGVASRRSAGELDAALRHDQFHLVYQPLFELSTGRLTGVEALIRWHHPVRGVVPPGEFVPAAEENGMIVPLGRWVMEQALRQAARWRSRLPRSSGFSVAVNVSAAQLHDEELVPTITRCLRSYGLPAHALHVEITETAVVENFDLAVERVDELRRLGVRVAIDDFGTGHSSLAYLHRFHADILKIDRAFVQSTTARGSSLAAGIVNLASDLGAVTVAEGIETEEQADLLRSFGCAVGQGFYYARPSSTEDIDRILALAEVHGASLGRLDASDRAGRAGRLGRDRGHDGVVSARRD